MPAKPSLVFLLPLWFGVGKEQIDDIQGNKTILFKMSRSFLGLTLGLLVLLVSCEKDEELRAGGDACYDFNISNGFGTNLLVEADIQHRHPCFNPQNGNEFVYVYTDHSLGICQLRKHDHVTGDWQVLVEAPVGTADRILGPPSWGSNGWILYHTSGWDTWKVKDDGTGLTRLTFTGLAQWPVWNPNGLVFQSSSFSGANNSLIRNEEGAILDTLLVEDNGFQSGVRSPCWAYDTLMYIRYGRFSADNFGVASLSLASNKANVLYSGLPSPHDIDQISLEYQTNKLFFTTREGLFQVNLENTETCKVLDFCTSVSYDSFSIAPQGGFMLATRTTTQVIDENAWTIEFDRDIYRINLTNFEETKVNLP